MEITNQSENREAKADPKHSPKAPADKAQPQSIWSDRLRWNIAFHVVGSILALLAIVIMVNYLATRHFDRFYLGKGVQARMSQRTLNILHSLDQKVRVVVFFDREAMLFKPVSALLDEYDYASSMLKLEYVDYYQDPGKAQIIKNEFGLPPGVDQNVVIFQSEGRTKIVSQGLLSEYDIEKVIRQESNEVKRIGFKGEQMFTAAILSVTDPDPLKLYHLIGHGEHSIIDYKQEMGYGAFSDVLKENNIDVEPLFLMETGIPEDCRGLILAGPVTALHPKELQLIDEYLQRGGRLFCLMTYFSIQKRTGVAELLAKWGVDLGVNVIFDRKNTLTERDILIRSFGAHSITQPLIQAKKQVHLVLPRSVEEVEGLSGANPPEVQPLLLTTESGEEVTEMRDGAFYHDPYRDRRGEISVGVAVRKGLKGISSEANETRIVVMGDSMFLSNQMIPSGSNREFAGMAINWLLDRTQLLGDIGPQPVTEYRIDMTQSEIRRLSWVLLAGAPGCLIAIGCGVWLRRRY